MKLTLGIIAGGICMFLMNSPVLAANTCRQYLNGHHNLARQVEANPSLIHNRNFLNHHQDFRQFLNNHPGACDNLFGGSGRYGQGQYGRGQYGHGQYRQGQNYETGSHHAAENAQAQGQYKSHSGNVNGSEHYGHNAPTKGAVGAASASHTSTEGRTPHAKSTGSESGATTTH